MAVRAGAAGAGPAERAVRQGRDRPGGAPVSARYDTTASAAVSGRPTRILQATGPAADLQVWLRRREQSWQYRGLVTTRMLYLMFIRPTGKALNLRLIRDVE